MQKRLATKAWFLFCANCRRPMWDTFTTCVICAVVNEENEVALLRQDYISKTHYVCVSGVMKPGESAKEAAVREIKEELGLDVERLEYMQSYPYDKKDMLMLGFKATVKKASFRISQEVCSVAWIRFDCALDNLREGSIAWQLVKCIIE